MLEKAALALGIAFAFTAPGYAWSHVLPHGQTLGRWERWAAAIGLSLGLTPLSVFWLSWLVNMPVTLLDTFLVALTLSIAPLGYLWLRRRGATARPRAAPPGTRG